jgi:hypothetical protein
VGVLGGWGGVGWVEGGGYVQGHSYVVAVALARISQVCRGVGGGGGVESRIDAYLLLCIL